MEIEEIEAEPIISTKINRGGYYRKVQFGHLVPYRLEKCDQERIGDDCILAEDDKITLELGKTKREEEQDFRQR